MNSVLPPLAAYMYVLHVHKLFTSNFDDLYQLQVHVYFKETLYSGCA